MSCTFWNMRRRARAKAIEEKAKLDAEAKAAEKGANAEPEESKKQGKRGKKAGADNDGGTDKES